MNYKIIFLILGFASVHSLKSQTNGFFINYTPEDSIRYSIKYHIKQPDNLIYILNKEDFSRNGSKTNGSFLIKSNYQGNILSETDLGNDSLKSVYAYGSNFEDNIQTFCFAVKGNKLYLIYRLFSHNLEEEINNVFYIDTVSISSFLAYDVSEIHKTTGNNNQNFIALTIQPEKESKTIGMIFDNKGEVEIIKLLEKNFRVFDAGSLLYNPLLNQLNYIISEYKFIYDDHFNYIKRERVGNSYPTANDTTLLLYGSILEHDGKLIGLGRDALIYNKYDPDNFYAIAGRGISEIDYNMRVKGKITLTPMNMTQESDGVARNSSSLFYRDGHYYTIFEYQDNTKPLPARTTFYITTFDTLFNIIEETHYIVNDDYRFFIYWVDFSEQQQFSASGFYMRVKDSVVQVGNYILGFNLDGSQPSLSKESNLISAAFKIKGNPTHDFLNISTDNTTNHEYEVRLYDLSGNLILSCHDWHDGNISIPVYHHPPGMYIYQVMDKGKILTTGKFVKS